MLFLSRTRCILVLLTNTSPLLSKSLLLIHKPIPLPNIPPQTQELIYSILYAMICRNQNCATMYIVDHTSPVSLTLITPFPSDLLMWHTISIMFIPGSRYGKISLSRPCVFYIYLFIPRERYRPVTPLASAWMNRTIRDELRP